MTLKIKDKNSMTLKIKDEKLFGQNCILDNLERENLNTMGSFC